MSQQPLEKRLWTTLVVIPVISTGCSKPFISVNDTALMEGIKTPLVAFVDRKAGFDNWAGVSGVEVGFWVEGAELAKVVTDAEGQAHVECALPATARRFEARATHHGHELQSEGKIFPWPNDRTIIACDIDGTISWTDFYELVLHQSEKTSKPIEGSAETLHDLSSRYNIFYLTARERFFLDMTKDWLVKNGFPEGPVILSATVDDGIHAERFKRETIARLQQLTSNVLIGIGNKSSDAEAYGARGLITLIRHESDDRQFRAHALVFEDWKAIREFFDANREVLENPERLRTAIETNAVVAKPLFPYKKLD